MPKPPYFRQNHDFSCVPACLKMVLASFDFEISETELRSRCECDETGTTISNAIKAINELGFSCYKANLEIEELANLIKNNLAPIVFLRFQSELNFNHAVVVYQFSANTFSVLDPINGDCEIDMNKFTEIWTRGLTIVVE